VGPALRYAVGDNNLAPMSDTLPVEQFEAEVAVHRQLLFKLAMVQLQDTAAADDVVQETILAALLGRAKFRYQSSIKTWLISIMRYKVVDAIRSRHRYVLAPTAGGVDDDAIFDTLFDSNGCWRDAKDAWSDPESTAERSAFFKVLEACLTRLPERTSRAFMMREWLEMDPREIQSLLNVSPTNLRALLYRARMQLRLCLDLNWER
jgi:RNA polymerase sigma-70 factor (ECF subfamily)